MEELAEFFEVSKPTLYQWCEDYPSFFNAVDGARLLADGKVAKRLYKRATGFEREGVKIFAPNFSEGGTGEPVYAPYTEYYPPDTQAASLWLRNRQPRLWRERHEVVATVAQVSKIESTVIDGTCSDVTSDLAPAPRRDAEAPDAPGLPSAVETGEV